MAVHQEPRLTESMQVPDAEAAQTARRHGAVMTPVAAKAAAAVRIVTGFVFLWAFLDKTFGWRYATGSGKGWIDGGSPTKGFLSGVAAGPFQSAFHNIAGNGWIDTLFMLGLLGIGLGLVSGVALRLTAAVGTLLMAMMWAAEWPLAQHLSSGDPSGSANPLVDYHVIYAIVMVLLAVAYAGNTWGFGRIWAQLPFVRRSRWLL
jgi:thiosulfate dehydrogenase [quinone] large subunit